MTQTDLAEMGLMPLAPPPFVGAGDQGETIAELRAQLATSETRNAALKKRAVEDNSRGNRHVHSEDVHRIYKRMAEGNYTEAMIDIERTLDTSDPSWRQRI